MKNFLSLLLACAMSITACACDPLTSSKEQFLWKQSLSDGKLIEGEFPNVLYQGKILALGNQFSNGKQTIYCFNSLNGEILWKWSDWYLDNGYVLIDYVYAFDNKVVISSEGLNYGIDMNSGVTLWRNRVSGSQGGTNGCSGIGNLYFFGAYFSGGTGQLLVGNLRTGKEDILVQFPKGISPAHSSAFVSQNSDTMLVYFSTYGEAATNFYNKTFLTLFNISKKQEVYNLLQKEGPSTVNSLSDGNPILSNDKIYSAIGFGVQANRLETGELLWRTDIQAPFTTSGIIEGDGIIFGNSSDGFMHAFDTQTGKLLWKVETFGTARRPFYMNGVVYVVSPGGGKLYAFDGKTGTKIWDFLSPDDGQGAGSSFTGIVTGANGKIYVRSYLNLYCYKAAR